jgi:RHS repeat-associated protein
MEEANGLDFMRARFYDGETGRFVSMDPIGLNGGDENLYRYVGNSPTNAIDPEGMALFAPILPFLPWIMGGVSAGLGAYSGAKNKCSDVAPHNSNNTRFNALRASVGGAVIGAVTPNSGKKIILRNLLGKGGLIGGIAGLGGYGLGHKLADCPLDPPDEEGPQPNNPVDQAPTGVGGAVDPNDIIGPAGVGEENWLTSPQTLPYTIRFENDPEKADAPAVFVTVTQQLDSDLDWNSFELGNFGFGDINIEIPPGYQNYTERIDLTETIGYLVDFNAEMNAETGAVKYTLETIDPETGEYPTDFDAGFLPPNVNPPEGDGFISYTISPGQDVQTGDVIDAKASIVFDTNDPIATPPVFNTIDITAPTSKVEELPETTSGAEIEVTWTGEDQGSGVATYDIYVSENGGDFELWLDDTTETSATYTGEIDKTYAFYSVATDKVGQVETTTAQAQATTKVKESNKAPTALELDKETIDENVAANSIVGKFSTTDPEPVDTFTYALVAGEGDTDNQTFTIDGNQLKINESPDFETKSTYNILVQTTDGGGATLEKQFTININDINEAPEATPTLASLTRLEVGQEEKLAAEQAAQLAAEPTSDPDIETILTSILPAEPILPIVDFNAVDSSSPAENTFMGSSDSDNHTGTEDPDVIYGKGGPDILRGEGGKDIILGDNDNDLIFGGRQSDLINGNEGNDTIYAGKDQDTVYGNEDNDSIFGDNEDDILIGNEGDDYLNGNEDNDTIYGSEGKDTINGGKNDDNIYGGIDNDSINGDKGKDVLIGEEGDDVLNGGLGNDLLYGGLGNNTLSGGQGSDRFILTPFEGINRITDLDNEDTLAFVGFSSEGIELVPNISENVTNIILNSKIIAVLENTQITAPNDLNFIEY